MKKLLYISFYTDGFYAEVIEECLMPSLKKFDLPYQIYQRPNLHNWHHNGKYKTDIILTALETHPDNDIVFLDSDAQIIKTPYAFEQIPEEYNVGVCILDWYKFWHNREGMGKREVLGATLFFRNNPETIRFVEQWHRLNQTSNKWGQVILQELLFANTIKYFELPIEYCRILKPGENLYDNIVIAQHQASRKGRKLA